MHLRGEETSLNPLGLAEALLCALAHSAKLDCPDKYIKMKEFVTKMRTTLHECMVNGLGTRDLCGPQGLTTEQFVTAVRERFNGDSISQLQKRYNVPVLNKDGKPQLELDDIDFKAIWRMFDQYDLDKNGSIDVEEFTKMIIKLGVAPKKEYTMVK